MSELPASWARIPLETLCMKLVTGRRPKGGVRGIDEGVLSLGGEHISERGHVDVETPRFVPVDFTQQIRHALVSPADILIVKDGATTGKVAIADERFESTQAYVNEHVFLCRISQHIEPEYVFFFLRSEVGKAAILNDFRGAAQGGISRQFAQKVVVPVAPSGERQRLLVKVKRSSARTRRAREQLERVPRLVQRYKQAILAAAFRGELTAEWRAQLGNGDDQVKNVRLGDLVSDLCYGTSKKCEYGVRGAPVLRIPNVSNGRIDTGDLKYAEFSASEIAKLALRAGDVLVIRSNGSLDLVGRAALVSDAEAGYLFAGYLIRVRPNSEIIEPRFLLYAFSEPSIRLRVEALAKSTSGVHNINSHQISSLTIPLRSVPEQQEIVRRIEAAFAWTDRIAREHSGASRLIARLDQSILAKAFRGALVPQDPNDEPASVLLERIRAERERTKQPRNRARVGKKRNSEAGAR